MVTSAILATYPPRQAYLPATVASLINQVDELIVVANEYEAGMLDGLLPTAVKVVIPPYDLKDEGKFLQKFEAEQFVLMCDDDIIYPLDYVEKMRTIYEKLAFLGAVVGVHGVTYSDFFEGKPESRIVNVFTAALPNVEFVNQLGTGTVFCRGYQMPSFEFIQGSAKFVDVRFAIHCHRNGYPRICAPRTAGWLQDQDTGSSLFSSFTSSWPDAVTREAQEIAGVRYLPNPQILRKMNNK